MGAGVQVPGVDTAARAAAQQQRRSDWALGGEQPGWVMLDQGAVCEWKWPVCYRLRRHDGGVKVRGACESVRWESAVRERVVVSCPARAPLRTLCRTVRELSRHGCSAYNWNGVWRCRGTHGERNAVYEADGDMEEGCGGDAAATLYRSQTASAALLVALCQAHVVCPNCA